MVPLELRFELAADAPIGVAEVIVDRRIRRLQADRPLEFADGLVIVAKPEVSPAEAVDDIAVLRPQRDGAAQHLEALVEMDALVDPGIAEIVQHQRLVGIDRQGLLEVVLRFWPLLVALVGDASEVKQSPKALSFGGVASIAFV